MAADDGRPPVFNYVLSFILVGFAWGFTTPFIRRAARTHKPPAHPLLDRPSVRASWLRTKLYGALFAVVDLLKNPRYAVPLLLNLTGSVWFFLLIGRAELSLTVPIVNTLAFLFTVMGDWYVDGKVISRGSCGLSTSPVVVSSMQSPDSARHRTQGLRGQRHGRRVRSFADARVCFKETAIGVVLSLVGIALCVQSKS